MGSFWGQPRSRRPRTEFDGSPQRHSNMIMRQNPGMSDARSDLKNLAPGSTPPGKRRGRTLKVLLGPIPINTTGWRLVARPWADRWPWWDLKYFRPTYPNLGKRVRLRPMFCLSHAASRLACHRPRLCFSLQRQRQDEMRPQAKDHDQCPRPRRDWHHPWRHGPALSWRGGIGPASLRTTSPERANILD